MNNLRLKRPDGSPYPDWKEYRLGDIFTERKEKGEEGLPMLSVSIHSGVSDKELDEEELGKAVKRSEDKTLYKRVYAGDLAFNMMRAWQGAFGVAKLEGMISPAYIVAEPDTNVIYPPFMDYCMTTPRMINKAHRQSYGVTDFRLRLYWDSFAAIKCSLPSKEEQKRITDLFISIDDTISRTEEEIVSIENQRKEVLNQIFSHEISFKNSNGEEYPAWEEAMLGDLKEAEIIAVKRGNVIPRQTGLYPVYSSSAQNNGQFCTCDTYMFDEELVTWSIDGGGRVFYRPKHKFSITNVCGLVRVLDTERLNCRYLAYNMEYLHSHTDFNYMFKALPTTLETLDIISIPCMEEQEKIVSALSVFDEALVTKKEILESWTSIKKGLMQQMFI